MLVVGIVLFVVVVLVFTYALCKTAGQADEEMEEMWNKGERTKMVEKQKEMQKAYEDYRRKFARDNNLTIEQAISSREELQRVFGKGTRRCDNGKRVQIMERNVYDFLGSLQKLIAMLENKEYEKTQWQSIAEGTAGSGEGERVQSSSDGKKMEAAIVEKSGVEDAIKRLKESIDSRVAIIEQLPADEYDLIHKVYVQDYTLRQFARTKNRGYTWACNKHKAAKENLQAILNARD